MEIIGYLTRDHKKIKAIIKKVTKGKRSPDELKELFPDFERIVVAHAKSEERALYEAAKKVAKTEDLSLEGYTEHALVDVLIDEMKRSTDGPGWKAKFKVACELLEHHIKEEEKDLFPKVRKAFDLDLRREMGETYDLMYGEKSGETRRPRAARKRETPKSVFY